MSTLRQALSTFRPGDEYRDRAFQEELDRWSIVGLRAIAGLCLAWSSIILLAGLAGFSAVPAVFGLDDPIVVLVIGLATMSLSLLPGLKHPRWLGLVAGYLIAVEEIWGALDVGVASVETDYFIPRIVIMVMLVILVALPLTPLQTLGLGLSITATYPVIALIMGRGIDGSTLIPLVIMANVVLMSTGLTAVVYHRRASAFRTRGAAQQAFEELRRAHTQLLITKNAASQMRFAAALSHELNSPIAALVSALDTMLIAAERERRDPQRRQIYEAVFSEAARSAVQSSNRLRALVERMKRLTNLDRAEEQIIDLNALLMDIVALLRPEIAHRAQTSLELEPIPPVKCRPRQIGAVLSNLIRNAASALDRDGTIRIRSGVDGNTAVIEIRDDGRGIPADRMAGLFDPEFKIEGGRLATTNWGLFMARGIISEHGGRLEIDSVEDRGTSVTLSIPLVDAASLACGQAGALGAGAEPRRADNPS